MYGNCINFDTAILLAAKKHDLNYISECFMYPICSTELVAAMAFLEGSSPIVRLPLSRAHSYRSHHLKRTTCIRSSIIGTGNNKTTSGVKPEQSSLNTQTAAFRTWSDEKHICMPGLEISEFADGLRGVRATVPLSANAPLISVPASITLQVSSLDRSRSPFPEKIHPEAWKKLPWYARLALKLHDKKNDPSWQEWISLLPDGFDTPFHWPEADLVQLQSPTMTNLIHLQRKSYRKLYIDLISDTRNAITKTMSYEDFVWAIDCVRSRSFSGELEPATFKERFRTVTFISLITIAWPSFHLLSWNQSINGGLTALFALVLYDILFPNILKVVQGVQLRRYALAPGIDFANHCGDVSATMGVAYEYFADKFIARSQIEYESGEQVFASYGAQSNDSLLQYYGFVLEDNSSDEYVFGEMAERLLKVSAGTLRVDRDGKFASDTIKEISRSFDGGNDEITSVLQDLCTAELDGFSTSLEEDKLALKDCTNARLRLAIQYRIGKKKILQLARRGAAS